MIYFVDDEDAWDALNEAEGRVGGKGKEKDHKSSWVPDGMDPVLEELPKSNLLSEIILEIEEIIRKQTIAKTGNSWSSFIFSCFIGRLPCHITQRLKHHPCSGPIHQKCSLLTDCLSTMNHDMLNCTKGR